MRIVRVVLPVLFMLWAGLPTVVIGQDLVDVRSLESSIAAEMRYAGSENFVGQRIDGYEAPICLLSRVAAEALVEVQVLLRDDGFGLLVFDCFRPQRAVDHFVRWAKDTADVRTKSEYYPNVSKSRLFEEGYIASRSGHSRASTVDLTLVLPGSVGSDGSEGPVEPVNMGTPFDFFDMRSNTESTDVTPDQLANRLRLRAAMEEGGFRNYAAEWWHYTLRDEPYPDEYFDREIR